MGRLSARSVGAADLFLNFENLFTLQPPPAARTAQGASIGNFGGFVAADDPIGRYFTMGIRFRH